MLLDHTPRLNPAAAETLAREIYGLDAVATSLPSERDQNFLLETRSGERSVIKIANALESRSLLEAQNAALAHLAHLSLCPKVVPAISGAEIAQTTSPGGAKHFVRLVTYLPATTLAQALPYSAALLRDLGRRIAQVDQSLKSFDHPAIHRDFHWDLQNGLKVIQQYASLIDSNDLRSRVEGFAIVFADTIAPLLPGLGQSAIHNDANNHNVLVGAGGDGAPRVVGLIDFGDLVHSYTVSDLAVAIAYAMLDNADPLAAGAEIAAGYHAQLPLNDLEIRALFGLVRLRLCMSVCHAAQQQRQRPEDRYLSISQRAIEELLPRLEAIDPDIAETALRRACGLVLQAPGKTETLAARRRLFGANLSLAYDNPLKIIRGSMQYLYDDEGRKYLDAYDNVPHVGHCHPRVVRAGQDQMALLNTNTRYLHDLVNLYAERLTATLPDPLKVCFFLNSGSEANELAIRLARAHTRRRDLIVLADAYHGNTTTLIDISPYKHNGPGGAGPPSWVHTAPRPDNYRGPFKAADPRAGEHYARQVAEIVDRLCANATPPAAFIAESWPSVAGQMSLPATYLPVVYETVRAADGVCIADEVQTAYGRLGEWFWGFEAYAVVPDIVVLGKPIGNGHPLGAVITTPEIAASFANGMEFFSTFGGNTVSCAIGLAVLDVVLQENLQAHALKVGERLLAGLSQLIGRHQPLVGDVRGSGLFLGVELVRDSQTKEPAAQEASAVVNRLRAAGILVGTDGPFHNVIKIRPPMPFSLDDADFLVETLDRVFSEME